jgi:hypothetical protein
MRKNFFYKQDPILPSILFNKRKAWALLLYDDGHSGAFSIASVNFKTANLKSPVSAAFIP